MVLFFFVMFSKCSRFDLGDSNFLVSSPSLESLLSVETKRKLKFPLLPTGLLNWTVGGFRIRSVYLKYELTFAVRSTKLIRNGSLSFGGVVQQQKHDGTLNTYKVTLLSKIGHCSPCLCSARWTIVDVMFSWKRSSVRRPLLVHVRSLFFFSPPVNGVFTLFGQENYTHVGGSAVRFCWFRRCRRLQWLF